MSLFNRFGEKLRGTAANANLDTLVNGEASDPVLEEALANFRTSIVAWSEAEFGRARGPAKTVRQRSWRLAAGWALGCVLVAGGVGSGIHEHQHKLELARIAATARAAEQQRVIAEQRAREEEDLLANVDSDVSREVPSAMEPLAQLMTDDETK
ncbi:MAG: hypothetical protein ABR976_19465 [Terracidiphilus sp.]|jgi:hypothetical protein